MASAGLGILPAHVRRRRVSFVLTSLIDVIFLLVIFFMVTSQIIPFSMIPLGTVAREDGDAVQPPPTSQASAPVAVRVLANAAMVAGETMPFGALPDALAGLKASGVDSLILIPTQNAKVQDVVSVLEAIQNSGIAGVTVLDRKGSP